MKYTAIIGNHSFELPAKTIAVAEKLDTALKVDMRNDLNIREKYQLLYDTIIEILGAENTEQALGGNNLENIDMSDVTLAFKIIIDAYDKPVADYAAKKAREKLASSHVDQVVKIAQAAQAMQNMKR